AVRQRVPAPVWPGPQIASLLVTAVPMLLLGLLALIVAARSISRATPMSRAPLITRAELSWQYLVAIGLITVAAIVAVQRPTDRCGALAVGAVLAGLFLPRVVARPWWPASAVDTAVAGVLAPRASRTSTAGEIRWWGAGGTDLLGHAILASLARPANPAGVLL